MMQVSERDRNIEAVAGIIHDATWQDDYYSAREYARDVNATNGWTFDVRYGHEGPNNWTRVEGLQLSITDLEQAVTLADLWSAGYYLERYAIVGQNEVDPKMAHAIRECRKDGTPYEVYRIIGVTSQGWLLWCPTNRRAGVALGGPTQWTDADSPADALTRRLGLNGKVMDN